ncbi:mechanosensitive ion channel family protein [Pseudoxanthomonas kalamensis]|uniref:mechanosensitive ion channel family protein n=1 Tax=Pseudoxanthomonas kalamensis TaxID=289483 RepID=UPI00139126C7|nr:mechanosensitive ion channel family protein [Pseudoxanthomonas kalamensis]
MADWWHLAQEKGWIDLALSIGLRILLALLVLYVGNRLARWVVGLALKAMARAEMEEASRQFISRTIYVALLVVLILGILQVAFGVQANSLIAVLGAAGLAVGLAMKDSLSNVASGLMLVSLKPFRVGDIVTIAGETGKVETVSMFQTRLRGADNQTIVLPNSLITADSIINLTPDSRRRIELVVGISYDASIEVARAEALKIMQSDPRVLADPAADVLVYELADNSVNLGIRCHVGNDDYFVTKCELTERIKLAFDAAGIGIPFPQRDVHMYHHRAPTTATATATGSVAETTANEGISLDSSQHQPSTDPE